MKLTQSESTPVSIHLPNDYIDFLKVTAEIESYFREEKVTMADLIREVLAKHHYGIDEIKEMMAKTAELERASSG